MANEHNKLHIFMFPWLAFGHIVPYLDLAKLVAQKGHKVTFISTPRNIDRIPKLPPDLVSMIDLVKLPLPQVDHLPDDAEATIDLPYDKVKYLKIAYDGLQQPMTELLKSSVPDWIFYDFAPYWVGPIASELGISSAFFSVFIAASLCFLGPVPVLLGRQDERNKPEDFTVQPKWLPTDSTLTYPLFEVLRIKDDVIGNDESGIPATYRVGSAIDGCDLLLVRSCYDIEPQWLNLLEEIHQKPLLPVGQLPPNLYSVGDGDDRDDTWRGIKEWLDKQVKQSVVYVAFGSEAKPTQAELTDLALGLEMSELPFFWVLRKRRGSADTELTQLPDGFEERTRGRGVVCTSWVPQLRILSHGSVGGSLTHAGWSTVVEALQFGKVLILFTFSGDQGLNARLLEEKKLGYLIPRNDQDGSFTRDSVAESLSLVMVREEGKIYRDKVMEMREVFGDRDKQDRYVNNLLSYLQSHRRHSDQHL